MKGKTSKLKPVATGAGKIWDIQHFRYLSQLGIGIFIGVLFYNRLINGETSLYPSPEAFCPLGGLESAYGLIVSGGKFIQHTHFSNVILFVALLITAVVTGGFFCGWICPLGAIQQLVTGIRRWLQKRIAILGQMARWVRVKSRPAGFIDRWLRYAKYLVLVWIIWGTITAGYMVFREIDPWAGLITIGEAGITIGFWVFIGTIVASIIGDRVWCRYLCPLGAIIGLVSKLSFIKVQREADSCIACRLCTNACPMNIDVDRKSRVSDIECNMCLQCVDTCPAQQALETRFSLPFVGKANKTST
jgi:polyferredoxin